jgi:DNA replication ATP-dependent helicase Dna2
VIQTSLDKGAKVEELLITPTPSASAKAPLSLSKLGLKKLNPDRDVDFNCNPTTLSNSSVSGERNPFRTPPSLSCRVDKVIYFLVCWSLQPSIGILLFVC